MDTKGFDNFDLNKMLQLKKVVSELRDGEDVEGAFLVGEKDNIIACELKDQKKDHDIKRILHMIDRDSIISHKPMDDSIFTCSEIDYNGSRILGKKLDDKLTLFVMLKKRSYVSLAMLNFENTIRKIDNILDGFIPKSTHT
jgi:predicted regulator of Ras-like GTPase activity (Roadblock/LC7/MglB family)